MAKFNAEDYINELLSQSNYLPVDTTIDDRCIPEAKNCIEFFHNEKFIGNMVPTGLFPKQAEVFIKLFAEFCPYCTDMEYWMGKSENGTSGNIKVNESFDEMFKKVQLLEYGICPHCGARKSDLYKQGTLDPHTELTSLMGQRAGKSASTSMGLSYDIHKFLKVPNLQKTYDLLPGSPFTIPLVGMSFDKAKQLLYNALYEYLTKGNWFKKYHEFINEQQSALGIKEDLCTVKDTFARYRHKNIFIAPFGPDKRKLRGNTSICAACDEIGWMIAGTSDGIKFDADEIYAALNNSMMTAKEAYLNKLNEGYDNLPAPINFNLSSPSSKKDKICRLYEDSKHDRFMYGIHLSTWEMNPKLPFEGPTMQALKKKNEREFWRDFGAVPPNSSSAFFSSPDLFEDLYQGCNICKIKKVHHFLRDQEFTYGNLIIPKKEFNKPNRLLSMDAGFVNNSFAFTILHMTEKNGIKIPVYDAIVELIPDDQAPLNYSKIYDEIIVPMIEQLNIKLVCTDRWQNLKILSDIENDRSLKCRTKQYSVKYSDFLDFRQAVYDRNIIFPKPEILNSEDIERAGNDSYPYGFEGKPVSHFIFQAITVVDLMGKTVAKGEGLTDDLFRAGVLGYTLIMKDEYAKLFKGGISGSSSSRGIGAIASGGGIAGGSNICAIPTGISGSSSIGAIPGRR